MGINIYSTERRRQYQPSICSLIEYQKNSAVNPSIVDREEEGDDFDHDCINILRILSKKWVDIFDNYAGIPKVLLGISHNSDRFCN